MSGAGLLETPQMVAAVVALSVSIAALIVGFFAVPFYRLREQFRRDHFSDRLMAEAYVETERLVPALLAIRRHVDERMQEHPGEPPGSFLVDADSHALIDTLLGHAADYDELKELYQSCIGSADVVWKLAAGVALLAVLFPVLRFVRMIPPGNPLMTVYWMLCAVVAGSLVLSFVVYTMGRNKFMRLLEAYARAAH